MKNWLYNNLSTKFHILTSVDLAGFDIIIKACENAFPSRMGFPIECV